MSPKPITLLLPFVFACETNLTSLADNPEDLTDVQIQELINSSGMNEVDAAVLEEEIHALLDECLDGNDEACDELSDIIEDLEDESEDDSSEEDDSEDDESEDDDSESDQETDDDEGYSPELEF